MSLINAVLRLISLPSRLPIIILTTFLKPILLLVCIVGIVYMIDPSIIWGLVDSVYNSLKNYFINQAVDSIIPW